MKTAFEKSGFVDRGDGCAWLAAAWDLRARKEGFRHGTPTVPAPTGNVLAEEGAECVEMDPVSSDNQIPSGAVLEKAGFGQGGKGYEALEQAWARRRERGGRVQVG